MEQIIVDKNAITGTVKPMHCVNNFPMVAENLDGEFAGMGIPYTRLHDAGLMSPHLVDIAAVFPDFGRDADDCSAYDFSFTDWVILRLYKAGVKVFYRLGPSIENYQAVRPYHIFPPADKQKWASVCEHIIAHYNEGWNNGYHLNIEYWEIWNEPDNYPDIEDNQMWKGTFEEYLSLYEIAARHLKSRFPALKIGGYASCGFYSILQRKSAEQANVSDRTEYFIQCFEKFLQYISSDEHRAPLDFFSWHSYSDVYANVQYARYVREMLDRYGFAGCESILNEWNPGIYIRGTLQDASNICANMLALQQEKVDMLMYYDCNIQSSFCGIFDPVKCRPFPAYYVFKAFSELYRRKNTVKISKRSEDLFAVSAFDGKSGAVLVTNNSEKQREIEWQGVNIEKIYSVTDTLKFQPVPVQNNRYSMQPYEVILAEYPGE